MRKPTIAQLKEFIKKNVTIILEDGHELLNLSIKRIQNEI